MKFNPMTIILMVMEMGRDRNRVRLKPSVKPDPLQELELLPLKLSEPTPYYAN